jgi:hypothetical protein
VRGFVAALTRQLRQVEVVPQGELLVLTSVALKTAELLERVVLVDCQPISIIFYFGVAQLCEGGRFEVRLLVGGLPAAQLVL